MDTIAGRFGRTARDRGAAAVEFGLLLTMISVVVTGGMAALASQVWGFDPCHVMPVCSTSPGQPPQPPGLDPDVQAPGDGASPSPSPSDCPTPVDGVVDPGTGPEPAPTDCPVPTGASAP